MHKKLICLNGTQTENEDFVKTSSLSPRNILWSLSKRWEFADNLIATRGIYFIFDIPLHYTTFNSALHAVLIFLYT